jgi:hypothetical protein
MHSPYYALTILHPPYYALTILHPPYYAAVAAGSFWRWDESLSPHTEPELFASVVVAINEILIARGIDTCPCANATFNGCNSVTQCGVASCSKTAA